MRSSSDDGPDATVTAEADAAAPERRCILTGVHGPRQQLIRLVVGPDGALWPDLAAKLPGRGAWVTADFAVVDRAGRTGKLRGALARSFRGQAPGVPTDIADRIESGLAARALSRLGLEHRAGHLIFGSDRISEQARAGRLHLLLHAADAADDGCQKLNQAFRVGEGAMARVWRLPAGRLALSAALGRDNMVHAGVADYKAAARIESDVARWVAFLSTKADAVAGKGPGADALPDDAGAGPAGHDDAGAPPARNDGNARAMPADTGEGRE